MVRLSCVKREEMRREEEDAPSYPLSFSSTDTAGKEACSVSSLKSDEGGWKSELPPKKAGVLRVKEGESSIETKGRKCLRLIVGCCGSLLEGLLE